MTRNKKALQNLIEAIQTDENNEEITIRIKLKKKSRAKAKEVIKMLFEVNGRTRKIEMIKREEEQTQYSADYFQQN